MINPWRLPRFGYGFAVLVALVSPACESVNVESYDADRQLRSWGFQELDHESANTIVPHTVRIDWVSPEPGGGTRCTGVLVGPDLVMTALHCLDAAGFFTSSCDITGRTGGMRIHVDDQIVLDSDVNGPGLRRVPRTVGVAVPGGPVPTFWHPAGALEEGSSRGGPVCIVNPLLDVAVVRLLEEVNGRSWARVRRVDPAVGSRTTIIHHRAGNPKRVQLATVVPSTRPGTIAALPAVLPAPIRSDGVDGGASGSPLYDAEGYVVGILSSAAGVGAAGPRFFTSMEATLDFLNEAAGFELVPGSNPTTRLGMFTFASAPLGTMNIATSPLLATNREIANGISLESDNSVILVGAGGYPGARQWVLARFTPDGVHLGSRLHDFERSTDEVFTDVVSVDVDGVRANFAAGTIFIPPDPAAPLAVPTTTIAVARYDTSLNLVTEFGGDGVREVDEVLTARPRQRRVDPQVAAITTDRAGDGRPRLIIAGHVGVDSTTTGAILVVRLKATGLADPSCNDDGIFVWQPEAAGDSLGVPDLFVTDVATDAEGRILLTGYAHLIHSRRLWVARLTPDCEPDVSFGSESLTRSDPPGTRVGIAFYGGELFGAQPRQFWAEAIAYDPAVDRIYVAGTVAAFNETRGLYGGRMVVVAFTSGGTLDTSFDDVFGTVPPGVVDIPTAGWDEVATGLALDADGQIFVAGRSYQPRNEPSEEFTRVMVALVARDGGIVAIARPDGLRSPDEWANDIVLHPTGQPILAGAHRAPPPFVPGD